MIDAKSLRLGNWILDRGTPTQVSMLSIGMNFYCINGVNLDKKTGKVLKVDLNDKTYVSDEDRFSEIELTPEILEGCGFKSGSGLHNWNRSDDFFLSIRESGSWTEGKPIPPIKYMVYKRGIGAIKEVTHLHQLQNLYREITESDISYHPSTLSEKTE